MAKQRNMELPAPFMSAPLIPGAVQQSQVLPHVPLFVLQATMPYTPEDEPIESVYDVVTPFSTPMVGSKVTRAKQASRVRGYVICVK
jgi:hypothetical protein